eukprot:TRINITY_DN7009_c1_g1_i3.p3 TRINITY_DN7009_c1_g1~~TRINITY_DN7009_c1_g1_i3.p3  ORF type:complete len:172 (+),score=4.08 TRINITY_DN7009_c1_g1_i3:145-660(+)
MGRTIAYLQFQSLNSDRFNFCKSRLSQDQDVWYQLDIQHTEVPNQILDYDLIVIGDQINQDSNHSETIQKIKSIFNAAMDIPSIALLGVCDCYKILLEFCGEMITTVSCPDQESLQATHKMKQWKGYKEILKGEELCVQIVPRFRTAKAAKNKVHELACGQFILLYRLNML